MTDKKETKNIYHKMIAIQSEIGRIEKTGTNPAFNGSKYAKLEEILGIVLPLIRAQNMISSHIVKVIEPIIGPDYLISSVLCVRLLDADSGEEITSEIPLILRTVEPIKLDKHGKPMKPSNLMQSLGGCATYAHRYGILLLLGITADIDEDCNMPYQKTAPSEASKSVIAAFQPTAAEIDAIKSRFMALWELKKEAAFLSDKHRAATIESYLKDNFKELNALNEMADITPAILKRRYDWLGSI